MNINLIVSKNSTNTIGHNNKLLFKLNKDMIFFKNKTTETKYSEKKNAVLMGKNTFDSKVKIFPLENRINIILSANNYSKVSEIIKENNYKNTYIFKKHRNCN